MRERAAATIFMWIAQAFSIWLILGSLRYTELVQSPTSPGEMIPQTVLVPGVWQTGAAILIAFLIIAAGGGTVAIWQGASQRAEKAAMQQAEKAKRDNRDAHIKRLLASMDDDDFDALEQERLSGSPDEDDRLSLEALLRKRG